MTQPTIFDENFEQQIRVRRKDIRPRWITIYAWAIIALAAFLLFYLYFDVSNNNYERPPKDEAYAAGTLIAKFLSIFFFPAIMTPMGVLVLAENRRAIGYNMWMAIIWIVLILIAAIFVGNEAAILFVCFMLLFIPYWIGLFRIKRKWEKQAVSKKGR
jgi:membrane-associated HD superfamily phosphohydrolase